MIIAVSGITMISPDGHNNHSEYKQEYYQPHTKTELKQKISEDFGKVLAEELHKLKVDILI